MLFHVNALYFIIFMKQKWMKNNNNDNDESNDFFFVLNFYILDYYWSLLKFQHTVQFMIIVILILFVPPVKIQSCVWNE